MRVKSKKSAEPHRGTPDEEGSGKDLGNFTGFANSRIAAHFHAARAGYSTTTYDPISAFLPNRLFEWIPKVAKYWFHKRHAFRDYTTHGKGIGIYPIAYQSRAAPPFLSRDFGGAGASSQEPAGFRPCYARFAAPP